jgi:hypothetical protein
MFSALAGFIAGLFHVFSGPDHLAAIAPLALNRPGDSWRTGLRWGLGHTAGVMGVGLISILFRQLLPLEIISSWSERLVGVLLIAIGFWGLRKAAQIHSHEHRHHGEAHTHLHAHPRSQNHRPPAHRHGHAAFGIGTLHGLAGGSHFLGILPALAFPTLSGALLYLAMFGLGTILAMSFFSSAVGYISARCSTGGEGVVRVLMAASSVTASMVGIFWLAS